MGRGGDFYFLNYVTSAPESLSRRRFPLHMENRMSPVVFELTPAALGNHRQGFRRGYDDTNHREQQYGGNNNNKTEITK
jgi:hypothetical protein